MCCKIIGFGYHIHGTFSDYDRYCGKNITTYLVYQNAFELRILINFEINNSVAYFVLKETSVLIKRWEMVKLIFFNIGMHWRRET